MPLIRTTAAVLAGTAAIAVLGGLNLRGAGGGADGPPAPGERRTLFCDRGVEIEATPTDREGRPWSCTLRFDGAIQFGTDLACEPVQAVETTAGEIVGVGLRRPDPRAAAAGGRGTLVLFRAHRDGTTALLHECEWTPAPAGGDGLPPLPWVRRIATAPDRADAALVVDLSYDGDAELWIVKAGDRRLTRRIALPKTRAPNMISCQAVPGIDAFVVQHVVARPRGEGWSESIRFVSGDGAVVEGSTDERAFAWLTDEALDAHRARIQRRVIPGWREVVGLSSAGDAQAPTPLFRCRLETRDGRLVVRTERPEDGAAK
jgi:hypothetical protein